MSEEQEQLNTLVDELSDEALQHIAMAYSQWTSPTRINDTQHGESVAGRDVDGFPTYVEADDLSNFSVIQSTCWNKFIKNPHISSHVRDIKGSLTGHGWYMGSEHADVAAVVDEITHDIRNELIKNIPKFVSRAEIEGELFLALTVHANGFVEVDFQDPSSLTGDGDKNSGIFFHPKKANMPLFYSFKMKNDDGNEEKVIIPSIYVAHYPELGTFGIKHHKINKNLLKSVKTSSKKFKKLGNYKTFIVAWDRSLFTRRNFSHIYTTIEWVNHYENLKKWEIDHKKSAGSYLWVARMTDAKAFRTWLKMTPEERKETGLTAKKTPGGTLILPPGVELDVKNPNLPTISEQDTDIMHMVTSGLNKPEDMVTGQTKGDTFSGIKASRGPQADRTQDQIAEFERYLRYDFWRSIFVLRSKMISFPLEYKVREAYKFKDKKPVFKNVIKKAWELLDFSFPTSEVQDIESKARAYLGVKHGSIAEVLGLPKALIAEKLGINGYKRLRLQNETEEEIFPKLASAIEIESAQEKVGEPTNDPEDNQNKQKQK